MNNNNKRPKFLDNIGLKILALILTIVLWILVNSINDPIKYMTIANVEVKLQHTSMITDQGEVYTVLDNTDVVPVVTVKARRSIIEDLDKDDIYATADIENMTSLNTVEIEYYSSKYNSDIEDIDGSIDNVLLSIETKTTESFTLQLDTSGEVAEGYELDSVTPEQNQVRVSGPESVVSSIAYAKATVDISGASAGISTYADVKLYDADGNSIDTSNLTLNITSVKVTVTILPLKTVPLEVEVSGTPADGYITNGVVTLDPDTVKLAGRSAVLSGIESVVIDGSAVSIDGCTGSLQTTIDIRDYIPDGTSLADSDFDGMISVTIGIEAAGSAEISYELGDISLENIPSGYKAQVVSVLVGEDEESDDTFLVTLTGLSSSVDALQVSSLSPSIDIGAMLEEAGESTGTFTVQINLSIPEGLTLQKDLTATVEVVRNGSAFTSEMQQEEDELEE